MHFVSLPDFLDFKISLLLCLPALSVRGRAPRVPAPWHVCECVCVNDFQNLHQPISTLISKHERLILDFLGHYIRCLFLWVNILTACCHKIQTLHERFYYFSAKDVSLRTTSSPTPAATGLHYYCYLRSVQIVTKLLLALHLNVTCWVDVLKK